VHALSGSKRHGLQYGLDDRPEGLKLWLYALQFLAFSIANSVVIPVLVGTALGLDSPGIAALVQRTFFFCAVGSLLQAAFGHRYPIFEGPAGVWYTVFLAMGAIAGAVGKPLSVLRSDLELGLIVAGLVTGALGFCGAMRKVVRLFTPLVNGVFLSVMGLQVSASVIRGVLGVAGDGAPSGKALVLAAVTVSTAMWLSFNGRGFLRSIGILVGTAAGWIAGALLDVAPEARWTVDAVFSLPGVLAWGRPTYDPGVLLTCVVAGLVVLANLVASVAGMGELTGTADDPRRMDRAAVFTGISDVLGGVGAVVGFIPYASSLGLVAVSGVAARLPFLISTVVLAVLSLFPLLGQLVATLPASVGYAVLMVTFSEVIVIGVRNFGRTGLDPRSSFIIGLSLMVGVGVMSLPTATLQGAPVWARYLVSNAVLVSTALAMALEVAMKGRPAAAVEPLVVQETDR
jgi:xanthine/uracil permease